MILRCNIGISLRVTPNITLFPNAKKVPFAYHTTSFRIFTVGISKKWKPVAVAEENMEIKVLLGERNASNNARERYRYLQARKAQEKFERLQGELDSAVDDIQNIGVMHGKAVKLYEELLVKRGKLLEKMADIDIDCDQYYRALVKQPDPLEEFDPATLQALIQPTTIRLPSGAVVSQGSGYTSANDVKASTSAAAATSSTPSFNTNPGGPGIGSRALKNPQLYKCADCSRRFTKKFDLKTHLEESCDFRENKEPKYKCSFCGHPYAHKQTKREHEAAKHTHIYLYHCKCGRGFYYSRLAVSHRQTCKNPPGKKQLKGPEADDQPTPPNTPKKNSSEAKSNDNPTPPSSPENDGKTQKNAAENGLPKNAPKAGSSTRDDDRTPTGNKHPATGKKSIKIPRPVRIESDSSTDSSDEKVDEHLDPHVHIDD